MKNLIYLSVVSALLSSCGGGFTSDTPSRLPRTVIPNAEHTIIYSDKLYREDDSAFKIRVFVKEDAEYDSGAMKDDFFIELTAVCDSCDGEPIVLDATHKLVDDNERVVYETEYGAGISGTISFDLNFKAYPGKTVPSGANFTALQKFEIRADVCSEPLTADGHREPLIGEAKYQLFERVYVEHSANFYPVCDAADLFTLPRELGSWNDQLVTNVILLNDIDLTGAPTAPMFYDAADPLLYYFGTFDGNGYTISNRTSDLPLLSLKADFARVFDLTLDNFIITATTENRAGALTIYGGQFTNIVLKNSAISAPFAAGGLASQDCLASKIEVSNTSVTVENTAAIVCDTEYDGWVSGSTFTNNTFEDVDADGIFTFLKTYETPEGGTANTESGTTVVQ